MDRIDEHTVDQAVALLRGAAPESTIILFGSWARGQANDDSDLDFLVVEPHLGARRREMARLRDVLRPLRVPADVLVVSRETFDKWRDQPGTVLHEAAIEGRVCHAAP